MADTQQQPTPSPLEIAYNYMLDNDVAVPDKFDDFKAAMSNDESLTKLHNYLRSENVAVPDKFEDFREAMLKKKDETFSKDSGNPSQKDAENSVQPSAKNGEGSSFTDQKLAPVEVTGPKPQDWVPTQEEMAQDKSLSTYQQIVPGQQAAGPNDVQEPEVETEKNPAMTAWKTLKDTFENRIPAAAASFAAAMTPENAAQIGPGGFVQMSKKDAEMNAASVRAARPAFIKYAAAKSAESDKVNIIRSYKQIQNPLDALNYVVQIGTQGGTDIAMTVGTGGISSFVNEIGNNYLDSVMEIAKDKGITPEEVINKRLDNPAVDIVFGTIQATVDKLGAGEVVKSIGKTAIAKEVRRRGWEIAKEWGKDLGKEAGTELFQEGLAATSTAITSGDPGKLIADPSRYVDALLGGAAGAGTFKAVGAAPGAIKNIIEKVAGSTPEKRAENVLKTFYAEEHPDNVPANKLEQIHNAISAFKGAVADDEAAGDTNTGSYKKRIKDLEAYKDTFSQEDLRAYNTKKGKEAVERASDFFSDSDSELDKVDQIIAQNLEMIKGESLSPGTKQYLSEQLPQLESYREFLLTDTSNSTPTVEETAPEVQVAVEEAPVDAKVDVAEEAAAQVKESFEAGDTVELIHNAAASETTVEDDWANEDNINTNTEAEPEVTTPTEPTVEETTTTEPEPEATTESEPATVGPREEIEARRKRAIEIGFLGKHLDTLENSDNPIAKANAREAIADPRKRLEYELEEAKRLSKKSKGRAFADDVKNAKSNLEDFDKLNKRFDAELSALDVSAPATTDLTPDEQIARGKERLKALMAGKSGKAYDIGGLTGDILVALKDITVGYIRKGINNVDDFVREFRTDHPDLWDIEREDLEKVYDEADRTNSASVRDGNPAPDGNNIDGDIPSNPAGNPTPQQAKKPKMATKSLPKRILRTGFGTPELQQALKKAGLRYEVLKQAETLKEARRIIRVFGINHKGLNLALEAVNNPNLDISPVTRTGMAVDVANLAKIAVDRFRATGETDKLNAYLNIEYKAVEYLDVKGRDYGRAINMLKKLNVSPETRYRKELGAIAKHNDEILDHVPTGSSSSPRQIITEAHKAVRAITRKAIKPVLDSDIVTKTVKEIHTKTVPADKKPGYGEKNKIVTKDKYLKLLRELKGSAFSGVDPRYVQIGLYHIEAGARKFGAFSKRMIKDLGEGIKPQLRDIYLQAANEAIDSGNLEAADFKQFNKKSTVTAPHEVLAQRIYNLVTAPGAKSSSPQSRMLSILMGKVSEKLPKKSASGLPLTPVQKIAESVANRDLYSTVWEDTKGQVEDLIDTDMTMEEVEKDAIKAALEDFYNEYIGQPYSDTIVQRAIRDIKVNLKGVEFKKLTTDSIRNIVSNYIAGQTGLTGVEADNVRVAVIREFNKQVKEAQDKAVSNPASLVRAELKDLQAKIREIVGNHYTQVDALKTTLVEKFINEAGLTGPEASRLATVIENEFDKQTKDAKLAELGKLLPKSKVAKIIKKTTDLDRMIKLTNLGALDDDDFTSLFADKFGLTTMNSEVKDRIRAFTTAMQVEPNQELRNRESQKFADYLDTLDRSTSKNLAQWATSLFYTNILSGLTTFARNIKGLAMTVPTEMAVDYINTIRKNPAHFYRLNVEMLKALGTGVNLGRTAFADIVRDGFNNMNYDPSKSNPSDKLGRLINEGKWYNPFRAAMYMPVKMVRALSATDALVTTTIKEYKLLVNAYNNVLNDGKPLDPGQTFWDKVHEKYHGLGFDKAKAVAQARSERPGASKADIRKRVNEIRDSFRDELDIKSAIHFGQKATLNNDPEGLGGVVYQILSDATTYIPATKLILPIIRIPTNAMNLWLDWNPIWGVKRAIFGRGASLSLAIKLSPGIKHKVGKYQVSANTAENRIISAIKAGISAVVYTQLLRMVIGDDDEDKLFEVTADGYGDYAKNASLAAGDWQEFAFRVKQPNGKYSRWISYKDSPLGMLMASIGYKSDGRKYQDMKGKETLDLMRYGLYNSLLFVKEQNYIQSLIDVAGVFERKGSAGSKVDKFVIGEATRAVTGLTYANFYQQIYKNLKAVNNTPDKELTKPTESFSGAMLDGIINNMPFLEDNITKTKIDALGFPVVQKFTIPFIPDHVARMVGNYDGEKKKEWLLVFDKKAVVKFAEPRLYDGEPISDENKSLIKKQVARDMGEYIRSEHDNLKDLSEEEFQEEIDSKLSELTDEAKEEILNKDE